MGVVDGFGFYGYFVGDTPGLGVVDGCTDEVLDGDLVEQTDHQIDQDGDGDDRPGDNAVADQFAFVVFAVNLCVVLRAVMPARVMSISARVKRGDVTADNPLCATTVSSVPSPEAEESTSEPAETGGAAPAAEAAVPMLPVLL
ncbi:MAG: hypothetical protein FWF88_11430 [Peptococcaceae bacterium]|nr:hypothetical protein [Peptococcaceae bacterium]